MFVNDKKIPAITNQVTTQLTTQFQGSHSVCLVKFLKTFFYNVSSMVSITILIYYMRVSA